MGIDLSVLNASDSIVEKIKESGGFARQKAPMDLDTPFRGHKTGTFCPRKEVLLNLEDVYEDEEIDPGLEYIFALGTGIHEALQQDVLDGWIIGSWRCKGCGRIIGNAENLYPRPDFCDGMQYNPDTEELIECPNSNYAEEVEDNWHLPGWEYREVELTKSDPPVCAHPDTFIWQGNSEPPKGVSPSHKYVALYEIKTASEFRIKYGKRGNFPLEDKPLPKHREQNQLYMGLAEVSQGGILYVNKSGYKIKDSLIEHKYPFDEPLYDKRMGEIRSIFEGIRQEDPTVANRRCSRPDSERAEECPVQGPCWDKYAEG
jgi:hypothetical protein